MGVHRRSGASARSASEGTLRRSLRGNEAKMVERTTIDESCQRSAICRLNAAEGTIAAIHQPNYIPWLGYFFKIAHVHKFVFLDVVAYTCNSFVNRNYIKTPNGPGWLTIPVLTSG